jgi:hypothetical protein
VSETVTVWESGCYVDSWYGYYSTSRALVLAITGLGWTEPEAVDGPGPVLTLALWDLSSMGPAQSEGSREWLNAQLLERQCEALAQSEGWSLEEDLAEILADELESAEDWLNAQPQTPEGHYWGHSEYGGWGCWLQDGLRQCEGCGSVEDAGEGPDQSPNGLSVCCAGEEEL